MTLDWLAAYGSYALSFVATFGVAILIIAFGVIIGRILGKFSRNAVKKMNLNGNIRKSLGIKTRPEQLVEKFVKYFIIIIALITALIQIGIAISLMNFLLVIFGGVVLISFTLALRDFMPNFFAGLYIFSTKKVKKGDHIKFQDFEGIIQKIDFLDIHLKMDSKNVMLIPNSYLMKNLFIKIPSGSKGRKPRAK
tara:strand:- start:1367 stop:1948 length:582 start_codon:yes stop_codon:yes gene_type:complete